MLKVVLKGFFDAGKWLRNQMSLISALKVLIRVVLLAPLIAFMIFTCGYCAHPGSVLVTHADTRSYLQAEYGPWGFLSIGAVKEQIVSEIRSDMIMLHYPGSTLLDPSLDAGAFLINTAPTHPADLKSTEAVVPSEMEKSSTEAREVTITDQPATGVAVTLTQTTLSTETPTAVNSLTPSRTAMPEWTETTSNPVLPQPTTTTTSLATSTPSASLTFTATNTSTPTSTASVTATNTSTPTLTATPTQTATPTETGTAAGNTYWFSDQNTFSGSYLMFPAPQTSSASQSSAGYVSFETEHFPSGSSIDGGSTTVFVFVTNIFPSDRSIDVTIHRGWTTLGSGQQVIPGNSTVPSLVSISFPTSGAVLQGEGRFLMADFVLEGGVRIYWAGSDYSGSRIIFPDISPP